MLQNNRDLLSLLLDPDTVVSGKDAVKDPEDITMLPTSLQEDGMTVVGVSELPQGNQGEFESVESGGGGGIAGNNNRSSNLL